MLGNKIRTRMMWIKWQRTITCVVFVVVVLSGLFFVYYLCQLPLRLQVTEGQVAIVPEHTRLEPILCDASSYQAESYFCWNCYCERAIDGDPDTRWASAWIDDEWIALGFGQLVAVDSVVLEWEEAYGKAYTVFVSKDGKIWTPMYTETDGDGGIDEIHFPEALARFVAIRGVKRATPYGYSLWEITVYGYRFVCKP